MTSSSSSTASSTATGRRASLRCDNGPELIAWALRDWCRMSRIGISYIEPGSPWENPYVESFNGRVRDELLNIEEFGSLLEAQVVVEAWRIEYNTYRPHGALGGLTPAEVTRRMDHRTPTSTLMRAGPPNGVPSSGPRQPIAFPNASSNPSSVNLHIAASCVPVVAA